ncbi:acetyl-CoA synthetase, partial [Chloroflexota bacterium]
DFLEYLGNDDKTKIIVAYLEGIKEGKRFYQLAREISKQKPIVVWKGGATESGARAAFSHTGKIAGSKNIWEAMFKQAGIISVSSFTEVMDCLLAFYYLPLPKGRRIAIVSGMGGTGVGTSDNCIELGLQVPKLTEETLKKLNQMLPPVGTAPENPVDVGVAVLVGPHLYGEAIKILADDDNVDMLLAITPRNISCIQSIVDGAKGLSKPLVTSIYTLPELASQEYQIFADNRIPAYSDAKKAAFALAKLADYAEFVAL